MKKKTICLSLAILLVLLLAGCSCQHDWQDATCSTPKTCSKCGETEGDVVAHIQGEWEIVTEATYSTPGVKKAYCTLCGEVLAEESFIKERIQNGLFVFSKQELMDMLEDALAEYSDDFKVYDDSEYLSVADFGDAKVDYLLYFFANSKTVTRKMNDPLNVDSLMVVFARENNRSIHISTLIECCCPEIDTTMLDDSVKQIQDGKKVIMGNLSFITGEFQGYDALFIEIEG